MRGSADDLSPSAEDSDAAIRGAQSLVPNKSDRLVRNSCIAASNGQPKRLLRKRCDSLAAGFVPLRKTGGAS